MKYQKLWSEENHNYFDLEPALLNFSVKSQKKFGHGIKEGFMFGKEAHAEFYLSKEEVDRSSKEGFAFLLDNKKLQFLLDEIKKTSEELIANVTKVIKLDLTKLNNEDLWGIYDSYGYALGNLFVCYSITQPHKIAKIEGELLKFLKNKKIPDLNEVFATLAAPKTRFTFTSSGNDLFKSFRETVQKEDARVDKGLLQENMYTESKQDQANFNKLINSLNPPEKIMGMINALKVLSEERLKMRFVWMKALYYNELFLIELKRRFRIQKKDLRMYDNHEIESLIRKGEKLSKEKLEARTKGFLKILDNSGINTLEGEQALAFIRKHIEDFEGMKELSGMVASKGHVIGKVVIFSYAKSENHSEKMNNMQEGDIVVTEMTRPNIIQACKKAGAILTDEGGITCHAAIISRELKVPCIIGMRDVTVFLKEGDYVEVDAEKGIVKKISKEEYKKRIKNTN